MDVECQVFGDMPASGETVAACGNVTVRFQILEHGT